MKALSSSDSFASGSLISSAIARRAAIWLAKLSSWNGSGSSNGRIGTHSGSGADHDHAVLARQRRTWQRKLAGEFTNLIGAHLAPRFPMLAVAVQRDRTADWQERPAALFVVLDPKLLIEQPPPDHDSLAGEFGVDLIGDARDRQAAVDADQAPLGLAREDAEPFPSAHLADTIGRQVRQPVVDARMRFGSMVATVVGGDVACQPTVRLRFGLGFVEMVEGLVRVLDRAEWPLNLALGARRWGISPADLA